MRRLISRDVTSRRRAAGNAHCQTTVCQWRAWSGFCRVNSITRVALRVPLLRDLLASYPWQERAVRCHSSADAVVLGKVRFSKGWLVNGRTSGWARWRQDPSQAMRRPVSSDGKFPIQSGRYRAHCQRSVFPPTRLSERSGQVVDEPTPNAVDEACLAQSLQRVEGNLTLLTAHTNSFLPCHLLQTRRSCSPLTRSQQTGELISFSIEMLAE
jgi:hypothetical protein